MNKVVCDICGTSYEDSQELCPVCGSPRELDLGDLSDEFLVDEDLDFQTDAGSKKKNKGIFDYDEVNQPRPQAPETDDDFDDEEEEEYSQEPRSNTALVVILLVLIVLLLATAGFFFLRYFMPNMTEKPTEPTIAATTLPEETETEAPVSTDVPCTDLVVPGGKIELVVGGNWLMNVQVFPEDTTDPLVYVSVDDTVATVTEDGTVTAVAEGQTVIVVTCGKASVKCNVVVDNSLAEETVPDDTIPAMEAETGTEPQATDATEAAQETAAAETTQATIPEGEVLKLKKGDITMFARYSSTVLELDCEIPAESIYWFTMDSTIAIVNNGVVTATGSGITRIYGEYEGQQVECIVRCNF